ncbi:MAG: hypothetical protein ACREOL_10045 [Candidatus Dormibacteria bacterium]
MSAMDEEGTRLNAAASTEAPQTLADFQPGLRMTKTAWLIALMFLVAALAFFIVVVCLGVDQS